MSSRFCPRVFCHILAADRIKWSVEKKKHSLTVESRSRTLVTGVEKVIDSSPSAINMTTSEGALTVKGEGLRINAFSVESGELTFEGRVDRIDYHAGKKPLLGRIFK